MEEKLFRVSISFEFLIRGSDADEVRRVAPAYAQEYVKTVGLKSSDVGFVVNAPYVLENLSGLGVEPIRTEPTENR